MGVCHDDAHSPYKITTVCTDDVHNPYEIIKFADDNAHGPQQFIGEVGDADAHIVLINNRLW